MLSDNTKNPRRCWATLDGICTAAIYMLLFPLGCSGWSPQRRCLPWMKSTFKKPNYFKLNTHCNHLHDATYFHWATSRWSPQSRWATLDGIFLKAGLSQMQSTHCIHLHAAVSIRLSLDGARGEDVPPCMESTEKLG